MIIEQTEYNQLNDFFNLQPRNYEEGTDNMLNMFKKPVEKCKEYVKETMKSKEEKLTESTDRDNSKCVFNRNRFVGNDEAAERLCDILFAGMEGKSLLGPVFFNAAPSAGKTYAAKLLQEGLGWAMAEYDTPSVKNLEKVVSELLLACESKGLKVKQQGKKNGKPFFVFPKGVMGFFDEFHKASEGFLTSMLRVMERNDSTLITKDGIYDCTNVLWIAATTHIGKIYKMNPAMLTRFVQVQLEAPSREDVAKMLQLQSENKDWTDEDALAAVDQFGLVIREVLLLASQVNVKMRRKKISRIDAIKTIAKEEGIDQGMKSPELTVLQHLAAQFPNRSTYSDLVSVTKLQEDTLREMVLPKLTSNAGNPLIQRRNFIITVDGAEALKKRNLINETDYLKILNREEK